MRLLNLFVPLLAFSPTAYAYSSLATSITVTDSAEQEATAEIKTGLSCSLFDEANALVTTSLPLTQDCGMTIPGCNGDACPQVFSLHVSVAEYYNAKHTGLTLKTLGKNLKVQVRDDERNNERRWERWPEYDPLSQPDDETFFFLSPLSPFSSTSPSYTFFFFPSSPKS